MPVKGSQRVVSVIHGPVFGGAHNQLLRLDPELRSRGIETVAVLPAEAEDAARRLEAADIEVVQIPLRSFRLTRDPAVNARTIADVRRNVGALRGVIRARRASVVQVHGLVNLHALIAAKLERRAVAWQILDSRAPRPLRRAVMPIVVRNADVVTSWGAELARAHPGAIALGDRLVLVYPPVDPRLSPDGEARHTPERSSASVTKGRSWSRWECATRRRATSTSFAPRLECASATPMLCFACSEHRVPGMTTGTSASKPRRTDWACLRMGRSNSLIPGRKRPRCFRAPTSSR